MDLAKIFKHSIVSGFIAFFVCISIYLLIILLGFLIQGSGEVIDECVKFVINVVFFIPGVIGVCFHHFRVKKINLLSGFLSALCASTFTFVLVLVIGVFIVIFVVINKIIFSLLVISIFLFVFFNLIGMVFNIPIMIFCGAIAGALYGFVVSKWFS